MDVDIYNFHSLLPSILAAIESSRFVSLDFELSGIPRRSTARPNNVVSGNAGKQTLQERYAENKAAAEKFHILQVGLTCVEEREADGHYVLQPYNFQVSPLVDERLRVERDLTFQNGAVNFLMGHGFQMNIPFARGIPYLSFAEEMRARSLAKSSWDRDELEDISIDPEDHNNLALMEKARREITVWQQSSPRHDYLNIAAVEETQGTSSTKGLNRYQKRLIHQLIRAEYPELVSISRVDFIQIITRDARREDAQLARRVKALERNLSYQAGLRRVVEALCAQRRLDRIQHQRTDPVDVSNLKAQASRSSRTSLRPHETTRTNSSVGGRPLIVGHNLFLDLLYLHAGFIGHLPDRIEEFQIDINELFPTLIDTKYIADKIHENSPYYSSSLEDIDRELSITPSPLIHVPLEFEKYTGEQRLHEAGYDAFLTAKAMICLSAKMGWSKPSETKLPTELCTADQTGHNEGVMSITCNVSNQTVDIDIPSLRSPNNSDPTPISMLSNLSINRRVYGPNQSEACLMMPKPDDHFWTFYGNKLRVNGTIEEVCEL